jgi:hypothetical protein
LKSKWKANDADGNGSLDVKEITKFVAESGVGITADQHHVTNFLPVVPSNMIK